MGNLTNDLKALVKEGGNGRRQQPNISMSCISRRVGPSTRRNAELSHSVFFISMCKVNFSPSEKLRHLQYQMTLIIEEIAAAVVYSHLFYNHVSSNAMMKAISTPS